MKKLFSLVAVLAIIAVSNCTQIPENNDPILGVWTLSSVSLQLSESNTVRQEWIFNDAYLGRFHRYEGNTLVFSSDFDWEVDNKEYTLSYRDTSLENITVVFNASGEPEQLELQNGETFAIRE